MEKRSFVDQRLQAIDQFFAHHAQRLARQGAIVESFRSRGGRQTGPYFRLTSRDEAGRQVAVYLGRAGELVEQVRQRLAELQEQHHARQQLRSVRRAIRSELRTANLNLDLELRRIGLRRKGSEFRGWSTAGSHAIGSLDQDVEVR